jgi:DNA-binding transcriptional LysR family regulator
MKSRQGPAVLRRYLRHGSLPQLAAFEAVVRLGSAAQAAESLCIAPSTLSGHLGKLSEALGVRLFELQGKQLVPTPAALPLMAAVEAVFDALARCEQALAPLRDAHRPHWRERIAATISGDAPRM